MTSEKKNRKYTELRFSRDKLWPFRYFTQQLVHIFKHERHAEETAHVTEADFVKT